MPPRQSFTLTDLAARLNVSVTTISNAFNRPDQLSAELREHILAQAKQLGFCGPNQTARSLRTGKTDVIGVILPEELTYYFEDAVATQFLSGVAQVLGENGYRMLLLPESSLSESGGREPAVDGVIVYGISHNPMLAEHFSQRGKRVVTVEVQMNDIPCVLIDDDISTYHLTRWALENTPRDFAPVIVSMRNGDWAQHHDGPPPDIAPLRRLAAMRRALSDAGFEPDDVPVVVNATMSRDGLDELLPEWLDKEQKRLFLCMSDTLALNALRLAERSGLSIPDDVRLVGFDGVNEGQGRSPQLTTVYQDNRYKGRIAAQMALGKETTNKAILRSFIIYGESCPAR
ncbi:LacI family DNA-binding transcriptional regulator [Carnimonas bestiolae]|uniref:LacI family DNA-binding transcriptional regulator n=1 Tax=Carnimonas bestiolae TaxID=3402172 RepID=UPI003EDBD90D